MDVETSTEDGLMKAIAKNSDGIILMNYDQHEEESEPGPVASQDWFEGNLRRALKVVPKQKLICGMGNYGYDWAVPLPEKGKKPSQHVVNVDDLSVQEAWQRAADADADVRLDGDDLNAHFAYDDEDAHTPPSGVVSRWRDRVERTARFAADGNQHLCAVAPGRRRRIIVGVWDHPSAKDAPQQLRGPSGQ